MFLMSLIILNPLTDACTVLLLIPAYKEATSEYFCKKNNVESENNNDLNVSKKF